MIGYSYFCLRIRYSGTHVPAPSPYEYIIHYIGLNTSIISTIHARILYGQCTNGCPYPFVTNCIMSAAKEEESERLHVDIPAMLLSYRDLERLHSLVSSTHLNRLHPHVSLTHLNRLHSLVSSIHQDTLHSLKC